MHAKIRKISRIMFVCHGNICRSPMAEFIMKDMLRRRGIGDEFVIASSATCNEEICGGVGNPVYPPARAELHRHGIDPGQKRAVRLCADDYDRYDLFLVMDGSNLRDALRIFGGDSEGKVRRLMSYTERGGDVDDPWYSGDFSRAYRDIADGCAALLAAVTDYNAK